MATSATRESNRRARGASQLQNQGIRENLGQLASMLAGSRAEVDDRRPQTMAVVSRFRSLRLIWLEGEHARDSHCTTMSSRVRRNRDFADGAGDFD